MPTHLTDDDIRTEWLQPRASTLADDDATDPGEGVEADDDATDADDDATDTGSDDADTTDA